MSYPTFLCFVGLAHFMLTTTTTIWVSLIYYHSAPKRIYVCGTTEVTPYPGRDLEGREIKE